MTPQPTTPASPSSPTSPAAQPNSDTVENAAATPDQEQPFAELGLRPNEYQSIKELLGRRPTAAELAMYSVMWSEHCSYKSSKKHLSQFGQKTTEAMRKHLLVGIGQNAGVVDIGDGWAVTYKVESHNSPSFIEPFQGAATGVGGIVRDIISMGARPVAVMDQLRFGDPAHPDTARIVHGAVAGIGSYANSLGVPNIGGETEFDAAYQRNPLVNAMCVGVMRHEDIHLANATGEGNKVILFGARTGGDGIGGASILASETFDDEKPAKRPNVQVGDPFMEKLLIEACLELYQAGVVEAIQDLGAAGISCATSELASNGDGGMHVDLENVLLRDPTLTAGEILMSESQERMMAVVRPEKLDEFLAICTKWDVESAVIGEVNSSGRLTIDHYGQRIVDVDPRTVAHEGPVYDRPYARPAWQDSLNADQAESLPRAVDGAALRAEVVALLGSINMGSKSWITNQFDRYVQGNTVLAHPHDAGVIRVDEATGRGVAIATDANGRFTKLDPYTGAQASLVEAYRNVAATGAVPRAVSDCLNNGSPEDPDAMWQLVQIITGLADGCKELEIPVTGGNVSLYNSTHDENVGAGHINASINPTPVIAVLGVLDDVAHAVPSVWSEDGLELYQLGTTAAELSGSEWARALHQHLGGLPPKVDLAAEKALADVLIGAARQGIAHASHDLSSGGLIQAVTEAVVENGVGVRLELGELLTRDDVDLGAALFSESTARAIVAVDPAKADQLRDLANAAGVPIVQIGRTGADVAGEQSVVVPGEFVIGIEELRQIHESPIPSFFG